MTSARILLVFAFCLRIIEICGAVAGSRALAYTCAIVIPLLVALALARVGAATEDRRARWAGWIGAACSLVEVIVLVVANDLRPMVFARVGRSVLVTGTAACVCIAAWRQARGLGIASLALAVLAVVPQFELAAASSVLWLGVVAVIVGRLEPPRTNAVGMRLELIAMSLYLLSLALPAFAAPDSLLFPHGSATQLIYGIACLVDGWIVIIGWIANPLLWIAAILHVARKPNAAYIVAWLAVVNALSALVLMFGREPLIVYPHVGYATWLASIVCFWLATSQGRSR